MVIDEVVAQLRNTSLWTSAGEKLLWRVAASNKFEEVVNRFAAITQRERRDANVFIVYGTLLAWSTEFSTDEIEQYRLGMQADKAFNAAIAIDENNWDAWMSKASFYADSGYKPWEKEAVTILEQTITEQEKYRQKPRFVRAYIDLGKMYRELGRVEDATETWKRGRRFFPDNDGLQQHLNID